MFAQKNNASLTTSHRNARRTARGDRSSRPMMLEGLEDRRLMSVSLTNGTLNITGTSAADNVTVSPSTINLLGTTVPALMVSGASNLPMKYASFSVNQISISTGAGDDTVTVNVAKNTTVYAGGGSDKVTTNGGADNLFGDESWVYPTDGTFAYMALTTGAAGNDVINTGAGNDRINGDAGNDSIYAGAGNDNVDGGAGFDLLYGEAGDDTFWANDTYRDYIYGGEGYDRANCRTAPSTYGLLTDVLNSVENPGWHPGDDIH